MAGSLASANSLYDLMLGSVTFKNFEVPDNLPNLFGMQKVAVHDFAGGQRTVQQLGNFPYDHIEWKGMLFDGDVSQGQTAAQRSSIINQLRFLKTPISLVWGQFNLTVLVLEFEVIAKMFQYYDYRIKILPISDQTSTSNTPDPPLPETILANALAQMNQTTNAPTTGAILPAAIVAASNQIQADVATALTNSNQQLADIPATTVANLQNEINALQLSLDFYDTSTNYPVAAAALELYGAAAGVSIALNGTNKNTIQQISVINPNLFVLASQYYGSPTYWTLIASANNLQDYQLKGSYTLTIPPITANDPFVET